MNKPESAPPTPPPPAPDPEGDEPNPPEETWDDYLDWIRDDPDLIWPDPQPPEEPGDPDDPDL